jgi:uncharacterized protein with ParB-like and HNH nuclease domain
MKAYELLLNNFLHSPNVQFVIPVYQRNYDWSLSECSKLFDDIITAETRDRESHFIGSIVYIHEGLFTAGNVNEMVVIDGQQRLTTINILYVALYRFALETGIKHEAERIYNMFLTNQYVKKEAHKLKLKQTDKNALAFKAIIIKTENEFPHYSNVIENFKYFKSKIDETNFETILNGLNRLLFVAVSLERGKDDPQRIFESLNSTGLELSQSDLIRNYILMDLPHDEQTKVFETIWNPIEENAKDYQKQKSLVSDYIRDYLTLKNKKIPNKNKVYEEFKSLYSDKKDESFQQELENIKSLSVHYRKFINPSVVADSKIKRELEYISRLEINVAYPFLLQLFEDFDNGFIKDSSELVNILKLIQSFAWRRFIVGLPTNALNKIFMVLYAEVDTEEYYESVARALLKKRGSSRFPSNEEIRVALKDKDLYNTQAKNRNYLFEMLENYNQNVLVDLNNARITIEHIFPRNPSEGWSTDLSNDEFFAFKEKYLNTIGNLTLTGSNEALSNKTFNEKKTLLTNGTEHGFQFSMLWLNSSLRDLDKWNIANFEKRLEQITTRFLKIWEYPDVQIDEYDDSEEQNIFDADKPTSRKLEYFIFDNTKVEEEHVAQMYFYVIRKLYAKNSQLLLSNQDVIKVTRDAASFRNPQEVVNGLYIEANIDSNSKFNILKRLLTIFDLEDELFIKYASDTVATGNNSQVGRRKYWQQLLPQLAGTSLFKNVSPTKDYWINTGAGKSGLTYTMLVTRNHVRIELTIGSSSKEKNKHNFSRLFNKRESIEQTLGSPLVWEELPEYKLSRVKFELFNVNISNEEDWPRMNDFFVTNLPKFEEAFQPFIDKLN